MYMYLKSSLSWRRRGPPTLTFLCNCMWYIWYFLSKKIIPHTLQRYFYIFSLWIINLCLSSSNKFWKVWLQIYSIFSPFSSHFTFLRIWSHFKSVLSLNRDLILTYDFVWSWLMSYKKGERLAYLLLFKYIS